MLKDNKNGEMSAALRDITDWESDLMEFVSLCRRIADDSDTLTGKRVLENSDNIEQSWRQLLSDYNQRMSDKDNGNCDVTSDNSLPAMEKWAEETFSLITKQINVSDVRELTQLANKLETLQNEARDHSKTVDSFDDNRENKQHVQARLDRIMKILPKRIGFLVDKKAKIEELMDRLDQVQMFIHEIHNNGKRGEENCNDKIHELEFDVKKLMTDILVLERDVTGSGFKLEANFNKSSEILKENWKRLTERSIPVEIVKSPTQGSRIIEIAHSPRSSRSPEVSSPRSPVAQSLGSPSTVSSGSQDMVLSPSVTTQSISPLSEEVLSASSQDHTHDAATAKCREYSGWLRQLVSNNKDVQTNVDQRGEVRKELDRHLSLLRSLESKKAEMEDFIRSTETSTSCEVNSLKSELASVNQGLLSRKSELKAMLEHSDNFHSKADEVSEWLGKLERQLAGASVGKTRDVLLSQIRDVNQVMRELQKYGHHVTLFTQLCQRLVSIYSRDRTDGVQHVAGELSGRYTGLTSSCGARAKTLQLALESLNTFDREVAEFQSWLR